LNNIIINQDLIRAPPALYNNGFIREKKNECGQDN